MRRAIWMALTFMGTAPLVALAQQGGGGQATQQPAGSPSGTSSIERGQDTTGVDTPGAPGQQSAGSIGTATGEPATGGAGMQGGMGGTGQGTGGTGGQTSDGVPLRRGQGGQDLTGGTTGTGGGGTGGGQAAAQQAPASGDAMQRELAILRERVALLERRVSDLSRGTGGGGTGGAGTTGGMAGATGGTGGGTDDVDTANIRVEGPVTVATAVFDGRVVNVEPQHIDIVDTSDGSFYRLTIDDQTRAFVGPELNRIPVERLSEGVEVRTSFALISGVEHARNIVAQPE